MQSYSATEPSGGPPGSQASRPIRVVLADDHPIVLNGLDHLMSTEAGFEVVGRAVNGIQAVDSVIAHSPDVLVLDLNMPALNGLGVVQELKRRDIIGTRVVILTASADEDAVLEAVRLGVRGVVLKELAPRLLLDCIREVHAGRQWIEKQVVGRALERMLQRQEARSTIDITERELEIARMVSEGLRNKEVADRLSISEGTVKIHLHRIYQKLNVEGRMQLSRVLREKGLL
jgi:DNA-binding NarL/FixJ family response regulator